MSHFKFVTVLSVSCALLVPSAMVTARAQSAASAPYTLTAMSKMGDLAPFKTIASDTLKIVSSGDLMAARTRIKDLETTWDNREAAMKGKDPTNWTTLDVAIDDALVALRTPNPNAAECSTVLKALIAKMDSANA